MSESLATSSLEDRLGHCFRPEVKKRGDELLGKGVVQIANASDTDVRAWIKVSGSPRLSFSAEAVGSQKCFAVCTCKDGSKRKTCKHMWSVLRQLEANGADFLEGKLDVELNPAQAQVHPQVHAEAQSTSPPSNGGLSDAKARAASFRETLKAKKREADRALRARLRQEKRDKRLAHRRGGQGQSSSEVIYPVLVEEARTYFVKNGFLLSGTINEEDLNQARKSLARVFHPDRGGTHEESLELNRYFEILVDFLES